MTFTIIWQTLLILVTVAPLLTFDSFAAQAAQEPLTVTTFTTRADPGLAERKLTSEELLETGLPDGVDGESSNDLPAHLTDAEMSAFEAKPDSATTAPQLVPGQLSARSSVGGCHVFPGAFYKRSSGATYKYGTIGGHPSISCGSNMKKNTTCNHYLQEGRAGVEQSIERVRIR